MCGQHPSGASVEPAQDSAVPRENRHRASDGLMAAGRILGTPRVATQRDSSTTRDRTCDGTRKVRRTGASALWIKSVEDFLTKNRDCNYFACLAARCTRTCVDIYIPDNDWNVVRSSTKIQLCNS